ncbi:MAG: AAA family ATPase, partial [Rhizobiaceae bacterium]|nr:AAA family ATPase [Rhizobiaceae bacterium]
MSLNAGLTAIPEDDIAKHQSIAQSFVTKVVILENDPGASGTALAGTGRRFVSTVTPGTVRRTREVELARSIQAIRAGDQMLSPSQHTLLYRARRGVMIGLAVADVFARQTNLEGLQARNAAAPLQGPDADSFKSLLSAAAFITAFTFAAYLTATLPGEGEPVDDTDEPDYLFDTPQDAAKSMIAGLERAIHGAPDDLAMIARARAFAREAAAGLISRKARFTGLAAFENEHIRIEQDDFDLNGFDVTPGAKR